MALMSNSVTFSPALSGWGKPGRLRHHCHNVERAIWKCAQADLARAYWGFWSGPDPELVVAINSFAYEEVRSRI
jgi:hypothetical protein